MSDMKCCSACGKTKPVSEFHKHKTMKDGYHTQCKVCRKEYYEANKVALAAKKKEYNKANKVAIAARNKEYYEANKVAVLAQTKEYYEANKAAILGYCKERYEANKVAIAAQAKEYYEANKVAVLARKKEYREANKVALAASYKEYKQTNRDKVNSYNAKRRAWKLRATPVWSDLEAITELYTCALAFKVYTGKEYHVDHIVPLNSKLVCGLHVPANLQVLEASENISKGNRYWPDMP